MKRYFIDYKSLQPRRVAARWSAFLALVSALLGYVLSLKAYHYPHKELYGGDTINYVMQNWGTACIFFEAGFLLLLMRMQRGIYWFWLLRLKNVEPSELQKVVRGRVFNRAYGTVVLALFLFAPSAITALANFSEPARHDLTVRALQICGLLLIGLPSILAAWDKDS